MFIPSLCNINSESGVFMEDQSSVYSEKKLAYFETTYKDNFVAKPQDINVTVTAAHLFGLAYICDQVGTREDDPTYTRFVCSFDEITRIYVNKNNKNTPIYIQCDDTSKSVMNRRRVILPCFPNNDEIVNIISSAKAEYDKKAEKQRQNEKDNKRKALEEQKAKTQDLVKKVSDAEFEDINANFAKAAEAPKPADDFAVSEMLGMDEIVSAPAEQPAPEVKAEPAPAPAPEVKPAPAPAPAPKAKPAPAPAPAPEAKPAPAPAPAPEVKPAPTPAPAPKAKPTPAPAPAPEAKPAPAPAPAPETKPEPAPAPVVKSAPVEDAFEKSMYVPGKKEAKPKDKPEPEIAEAVEEAPAPEKTAPAPEKPAPKKKAKAEAVVPANTETMSLEDFQTAVLKLKSMLDNGLISTEEFAEEKKKLMQFLY